MSVVAYEELEGYLEYGAAKRATSVVALGAGEPKEILLDSLEPDTPYFYRLRYRRPGASDFIETDEHTFHTQRSASESFAFTVQADSHLDENTSPAIYERTLRNAAAARPDFHIDLGDTFMTGKRRDDFRNAKPQYLAQRYYLGLLCHSAPLFLALGNHDGEAGYLDNSMAAWSANTRRRYFPNPSADGFYTGGTTHPVLGELENYYAWEWGDALFLVLDPFWPTTSRRGREEGNWHQTLGDNQYRWLTKTLEKSRARFRFVFIHHLVGGKDRSSRGGIAAAKYFEWGGHELDGSYTFERHRPGWATPIHQLLAAHDVSIVFHGHDHLFAPEELDGVIYQLVPQPGHRRIGGTRSAAEYGYVHGDVLSSPGHVRVTVAPDEARVEYVRTYMPEQESDTRRNGEVAYDYVVAANR